MLAIANDAIKIELVESDGTEFIGEANKNKYKQELEEVISPNSSDSIICQDQEYSLDGG